MALVLSDAHAAFRSLSSEGTIESRCGWEGRKGMPIRRKSGRKGFSGQCPLRWSQPGLRRDAGSFKSLEHAQSIAREETEAQRGE